MIKRPNRTTAFPITETAAKHPQDKHLRQEIRNILMKDDGACYADMEWLLMGGNNIGSRQFGQAYAVEVLLEHDHMADDYINDVIDNSNLTYRMLWTKLYSVLDSLGYIMRQGMLTGVKMIGDNSDAPAEVVETSEAA